MSIGEAGLRCDWQPRVCSSPRTHGMCLPSQAGLAGWGRVARRCLRAVGAGLAPLPPAHRTLLAGRRTGPGVSWGKPKQGPGATVCRKSTWEQGKNLTKPYHSARKRLVGILEERLRVNPREPTEKKEKSTSIFLEEMFVWRKAPSSFACCKTWSRVFPTRWHCCLMHRKKQFWFCCLLFFWVFFSFNCSFKSWLPKWGLQIKV